MCHAYYTKIYSEIRENKIYKNLIIEEEEVEK